MTTTALYPAIKPSLLLDFANTKALDPRITFTRTTTAAYYDGKTVAKAEENLFLYSEEFNDAYWTKTSSTITADSTTAPDGTSTAEKIVANNGAAGRIGRLVTPFGMTETISIYAKAAEWSWIFVNDSSRGVYFDLTNGLVGTQIGGFIGTIVSVGDGWYRCSCTGQRAFNGIRFNPTNADNTLTTGDGTSGIFLWGAQLEQRDSVTAYTPTTTQPITNYIPVLQTAAAGQARFDHNPVTGESLGLLIEEQRANLVTYSEQFDNAAWSKTRTSVTANTIVSPEGTLTGDKLIETTGTGTHELRSAAATITAGATVTGSCYVKAGERFNLSVLVFSNTSPFELVRITINLNTESFVTEASNGGSSVSGTLTSVGNGWYRATVSGVLGSKTNPQFRVDIRDDSNVNSYTGNGYSGIYIWGAQLELGAFPTSYIPTVAATVTRNADAASMTGSNVTSWFSNAEGTLYTEVNPKALAVSSGIQLNDNTTSNRIRLATTSTSDQGTVTTSGTAQATLDGGTPIINTSMKLALSYKVNDFKLSLNGGTAATDTAGTVPVVNQLQLGAETTTVGNMTLKKVAYYPKALSAAEIQSITTV
jgi:hypothetical protein